ncbi:MAG: TetR/AcrR family transcriptional regulator [Spirochaetales bacterium]
MSTLTRRLREKEARRQLILETAEKIFAQKGFTETPMDEIARQTELSKGTLYLYFKSKEELAFAIFHKNLTTLKQMIQEAAHSSQRGIEKIKAILSAYYQFYKEHIYGENQNSCEGPNRQYLNRLLEYFFQPEQPREAYAERCFKEIEDIFSIIVTALENGIQDHTIRKEIDPWKTALTYGNLVLLFMLHLSRQGKLILRGKDFEAEELFGYMFDLFLHSLEGGERSTVHA